MTENISEETQITEFRKEVYRKKIQMAEAQLLDKDTKHNDRAKIWMRIGLWRDELGQKILARKAFEQVRRFDPDNIVANRALNLC